jgi:histone arginine demethylase JMJD6
MSTIDVRVSPSSPAPESRPEQAGERPAPVQRIAYRDLPPYQGFAREFLFPHKPVIITGALASWKALSTWTPTYFAQRFPDRRLNIDGREYTVAGFVDIVESSSPESPAPYLRNAVLSEVFPELVDDISPLPVYVFPNWLAGRAARLLESRVHGGTPELYIGGRGGKFPFLHFDSYHTHAFLMQIYGVKEYTCFPEDQAPFIYVKPTQYNASAIPDIEHPDLGRFPLFARATPIRFFLHPGEVLFVPGGLWHTARMLTPSITISVNRANASNWRRLRRDIVSHSPLPAKPLAAAYLSALGFLHGFSDRFRKRRSEA